MRLSLLAVFPAAVFLAANAAAQTFPAKPPKLYVGFVPGGGVDQTARMVTAKLAEIWGAPITVENRPGAGGTIAAEATAKARRMATPPFSATSARTASAPRSTG